MDPANIPLYYTALGVTRCPGARTPKPKQVTKKEKEVLPLGITVDFDTQKAEVVPDLENNVGDKSRATAADEDIVPLLNMINHHPSNDFFTTSSCAGRLIVTQSGPESGYNVDWLYVSHKPAIFSDIVACLPKRIERQGFEVWFKMESPIVAICVRSLEIAQHLIDVARSVGFKKPTITGVRGKVMVSIVDNKHIEIPVAIDANRKLLKSRERMERFGNALYLNTPTLEKPWGFTVKEASDWFA